MARTTISIPDTLKRRMDRMKEPVNWSEVAAEAFTAHLQHGKGLSERVRRIEDRLSALERSKPT